MRGMPVSFTLYLNDHLDFLLWGYIGMVGVVLSTSRSACTSRPAAYESRSKAAQLHHRGHSGELQKGKR